MGVTVPPRGHLALFVQGCSIYHAHDSHLEQRSIFSKRSTEPKSRKPDLDYKMLEDKSNVLSKNTQKVFGKVR